MVKSEEEQIFIGIGDQVIELTGVDKKTFLEQRVKDQAEFATHKAILQTKQDAKVTNKESALTKLQALGLTEEEINAIIN